MDADVQSYKRAEQLYSLAHLFTGDRELSVNLALETIDLDSASETIFAVGLHGSSRKRFIAKILAAIRGELSISATRIASKQTERAEELPSVSWSLNPDTTAAEIADVLLGMDIFPKCALLLTVFEDFSLDDASILLNSNPELVLTGRIAGLRALTTGLAKLVNGRASSQTALIERQLRHAC